MKKLMVLTVASAFFTLGLYLWYTEQKYQRETPAVVKEAHLKMEKELQTLQRGDFLVYDNGGIACFHKVSGGQVFLGFYEGAREEGLYFRLVARRVVKIVRSTDPEWVDYARRCLRDDKTPPAKVGGIVGPRAVPPVH